MLLWRLADRTGEDLAEVAKYVNPIVPVGYSTPAAVTYRLPSGINACMVRWICTEYRR